MIYKSKLADFKKLISKIEMIDNTRNSLIYWDKITNMPEDGIEYRSKVMAFMADEQYKMLSGREFSSYVKYFKNNKRNDEITNAVNVNIKMLKKWKIKMYIFPTIPHQIVSPKRLAFP